MISTLFRFRGHNSLRYVYSHGTALRSQIFTVKYVINKRRSQPRFSVVVSKKVIKSAVARNRIRRRTYEYIRLNMPRLSDVYDVVFICTSSEVRSMPADELYAQLNELLEKSDLYR